MKKMYTILYSVLSVLLEIFYTIFSFFSLLLKLTAFSHFCLKHGYCPLFSHFCLNMSLFYQICLNRPLFSHFWLTYLSENEKNIKCRIPGDPANTGFFVVSFFSLLVKRTERNSFVKAVCFQVLKQFGLFNCVLCFSCLFRFKHFVPLRTIVCQFIISCNDLWDHDYQFRLGYNVFIYTQMRNTHTFKQKTILAFS